MEITKIETITEEEWDVKTKEQEGAGEEYPGKRERNNLMLLELAFTHMTTIDFP